MSARLSLLALLLIAPASGFAQKDFPDLEKDPQLRLRGDGPLARITSLAFSPDGKRLYAAGYDKMVRIWELREGRFQLRPEGYHVPLGPGLRGVLNALAVSPDGQWLAAGGYGVFREAAGFQEKVTVVRPAASLSRDMLRDNGMIYLFDLSRSPVEVRILRGHEGPVLALAFAPAVEGKPATLVSVGAELNEDGKTRAGVIRLWDVNRQTELARLAAPQVLDNPSPRVTGLAVTRHRNQPERLSIALTWPRRLTTEEGRFVLWDWEAGKPGQPRHEADGVLNSPLTALAPSTFLSGSWVNTRGGQLRLWRSEDRGLTARERPVASWGGDRSSARRPTSLALLGKNRLAIALKSVDGKRAWLQLASLADAGEVTLAGDPLDLGTFSRDDEPVVAASRDGDHVAVSGQNGQEIHLVSLRGARPEVQRLLGIGRQVDQVGWLRSRDDFALELGGTPGLVFDLARSRLTSWEGWVRDRPDTDGWEVVSPRIQDRERTLKVFFRARERGKPIPLGQQQVTTTAILPPAGGRPTLLAAGLWQDGEPRLALFDVETGDLLRMYVGHVQKITSLAFREDGRLLASCADDHTVAVWSLTDLNRVYRKLGMVPGLVVVERNGALHVLEPDVAGKLAPNDVIEGVSEDGKLRALKTGAEFYAAMAAREPGKKVALQVRGKGQPVEVMLGQGADAPRPLFSLFLTRDDPPRWLAWSPLGHYDRSADSLEKQIGWHSNTGNPARPVKFGDLEKHREYFKPGILRHLVNRGEPEAARRDWEADISLADVRIKLELLGGKVERFRAWPGVQVLRSTEGLRLRVDLVGLPEHPRPRLTWDLGDGKERPVTDEGGTTFSLDLTGVEWTRDERRIRVSVRSPRGECKDETLAVRFVPPAPRIVFPKEWLARHFPGGNLERLSTLEPRFTVEVGVEPAQGVNLSLRFNQTVKRDLAPPLKETFDLKEGSEHEVEIVAVNAGARPETAELETASQSLIVIRRPPAPVISLDRIRVGEPAEQGGLEPSSTRDRPRVVSRQSVPLTGLVVSSEPLTEVLVNGEKARLLGRSGRKERFEVERLKLSAGKTTPVTMTARTAGDRAELIHWLYYLPEMPGLVIVEPKSAATTGTEPVRAEFQARLRPPEEPYPFRFRSTIEVNREKTPAEVNGDVVSGKLALKPGGNSIAVRLTLSDVVQPDGSPVEQVYRFEVKCLRLPNIHRVVSPEDGSTVKKASTEALLEVRSPEDLKPQDIFVNGQRMERSEIAHQGNAEGLALWRVQLPDLKLAEGQNRLVFTVRNEDGTSRPSEEVKVISDPVRPAPVVEIQQKPGGPVQGEKAELRFSVRSESAIRRVTLLRIEDMTPVEVTTDPKLDPLGPKVLQLAASVDLPLRYGPNTFRIEVVNEAGRDAVQEVFVSRPRPTVSIHLKRLEVVMEKKPEFLDYSIVGGKVHFGKSPTGIVQLHGEIIWTDTHDPALQKAFQVQAIVNSYVQPPVQLGKAQEGRRGFVLPLRLSAKQNRVRLDVTGIPLEPDNREIEIPCAAPEEKRRLHLLVVGVDVRDGKQLESDIIEAFQVKKVEGRLRSPVFDEVRLHGPLTGYIDRDRLEDALADVRNRVLIKDAEPMNDVLVVYFRGRERVVDQGRFLLTSTWARRPNLRESAVSLDEVRRVLNQAFGAQLLLMDLNREELAQPTREDDTPRIGRYGYSWVGPTAVPEKLRLLSALKVSLSRADSLGRAIQELDDNAQRVALEGGSAKMVKEKQVPEHLHPLPLSQARQRVP